MQKVFIVGNLGKDPDVKEFEKGKVANFSVGVTKKGFKTLDGKEIPDHTEWFMCVASKGNATYASYMKKGNKVAIWGEMKTREYEGKDGQKGRITELVVLDIENLTPRSEGSMPTQSSPTPNQPQEDKEDLPF